MNTEELTRAQVDLSKQLLNTLAASIPNEKRLLLVLGTAEELNDQLKGHLEACQLGRLIGKGLRATEIRDCLIGLQACRELIDEICETA